MWCDDFSNYQLVVGSCATSWQEQVPKEALAVAVARGRRRLFGDKVEVRGGKEEGVSFSNATGSGLKHHRRWVLTQQGQA